MIEAVDIHAHFAPASRLAEMRSIAPNSTPMIELRDEAVYFRYPDGTINGPVPLQVIDIDKRLEDMANTSISHQVLSARPQMFSYEIEGQLAAELAGLSNLYLVETASQHPDKFSVMIALPLQDNAASVAEIEKWATTDVVKGVLVDSNVASRDLADPEFVPIWKAIESADLPILVHPYQGDVVGAERLQKHYLFNLIGNPFDTTIALANVLFGGLLDKYPNLRWGFVHGGGVAPYLAGRWDHGWHQRAVTRELIPNSLPSELLKRVWFDCLVHDRATLDFLAQAVGWDRIMIGSDCPFDMGEHDPIAFVNGLDIEIDQRELLLVKNASRFLRTL